MKSDDVVGRVKTYEAIIKGLNIPEAGIPESFKVLLKELQSLGLDMRVQREDNTDVDLIEISEYGETDFRRITDSVSRARDREFYGGSDVNSMMQGDVKYEDRESYGQYGYSQQAIKNEEMIDLDEPVNPAEDNLEENYSYDEDSQGGESYDE